MRTASDPARPQPARARAARRPRRLRVFRSVAMAAAAVAALAALPAHAFTIFACEPEWAALARELMPEARIHVATQARQDPHHIEARPALIAQLRAADLAICTGASLEGGWLPLLQERAGNAKIQTGAPGMFFATEQVELIDKRDPSLNPFQGDVHAEGNPHVHTDPLRMLTVSRRLAERMQDLARDDASAIEERHRAFERRWKAQIERWEAQVQPLRGARVAAQHGTFAYLWRWLGVEQVADLEPRPGLSPTPGHLQGLLQTLRKQPPVAVVIASFHDPRAGRWVVGQLDGDVPLVVLPAGPVDPTGDDALVRWYDGILAPLVDAAARSSRN